MHKNTRIKLFKASALDNPKELEKRVNEFCQNREVIGVDLRVDPTKSTHSNLYVMVTYLGSDDDSDSCEPDGENTLKKLFEDFDTDKYWNDYEQAHPGENKEAIKGTFGREDL